jgi:hypothetical protein
LYKKLRLATFAILDGEGHPVCCGFFVTPCGVALTAAHSCVFANPDGSGTKTFRASTFSGLEFSLDVMTKKVGTLDIAVLRVSASSPGALPLPPRDYLPLPSAQHTHQQLLGAPVALIHGSIAWSAGSDVQQVARDNGTIITSNASLIHYRVSSYKGHSGAALLFRSGQVIGLHSEGYNDPEQEHSGPSTSADAVRLDLPELWAAVMVAKNTEVAAKGAPASAAQAAAGSTRMRKKKSGTA